MTTRTIEVVDCDSCGREELTDNAQGWAALDRATGDIATDTACEETSLDLCPECQGIVVWNPIREEFTPLPLDGISGFVDTSVGDDQWLTTILILTVDMYRTPADKAECIQYIRKLTSAWLGTDEADQAIDSAFAVLGRAT